MPACLHAAVASVSPRRARARPAVTRLRRSGVPPCGTFAFPDHSPPALRPAPGAVASKENE